MSKLIHHKLAWAAAVVCTLALGAVGTLQALSNQGEPEPFTTMKRSNLENEGLVLVAAPEGYESKISADEAMRIAAEFSRMKVVGAKLFSLSQAETKQAHFVWDSRFFEAPMWVVELEPPPFEIFGVRGGPGSPDKHVPAAGITGTYSFVLVDSHSGEPLAQVNGESGPAVD